MAKNNTNKRTKKDDSVYINNACKTCGQQKPRRKKRYLLFALLTIAAGYLLKMGYERTFKKTIIMNLMEDILSSKTITCMNLSETTKAKLLYFAEIAAFNPHSGIDEMPGSKVSSLGLHGKHPITIIPGIANTSLELWKTKKEHISFFRKRIWGSHSTLTFMLHNRAEWMESMKLNPDTGLDPSGIKVRASCGLESSDFSIPGMWFWWKIVENLSHIGYDAADVHFAAFDWRLGIEEMEIRDGYFTKLKIDIELQNSLKKEKTVIVAHSLGSLIFHYFMQWVSEKDKEWVDKHIHAAVYIGPPLLGAPKAIGCLIAGEVKDTADMGMIQYTIVELLFGREQRHQLFKTWGSPLYLLPKGGDRFWRRKNMENLDLVAVEKEKIAAKGKKKVCKAPLEKHRFIKYEEIMEMIKEILPPHNKTIHKKIVEPKTEQDTWSNPLLSPLPNAPNLTIYSLYGVNKPTECGYYFTIEKDIYHIDKNKTSDKESIFKGIVIADGDGTVPIISMGYMGGHGWKNKELNPHKVKTVIREYKHMPSNSLLEPRGGAHTAEHVNILGNYSLITDILKIASGERLDDEIISNLPELIEEIEKKE
ncbi:phospholipid:diacylglycerol acyltransferase [Nematocida minor]|uniref:phospholipid:diacylglycerol acyltransferase n=1 Tax=Nematocida minor TaxID=1912983 RepID=UPI00221E77BA|nr:phospholipid:diacylglycerol acyltransferase [Nematocida minor]KAI5193337.1 phospholipid:diacylglycerol acyltransferase [Nematocida minor]